MISADVSNDSQVLEYKNSNYSLHEIASKCTDLLCCWVHSDLHEVNLGLTIGN